MAATLEQIQRGVASMFVQDIHEALDDEFFDSRENVFSLLKTFDEGYRLTFPNLRDLSVKKSVREAVRVYAPWSPAFIFEDDAGYTDERMGLLLEAWRFDKDGTFWAAAAGQVLRLLEQGRVDPQFYAAIGDHAQRYNPPHAADYLLRTFAADPTREQLLRYQQHGSYRGVDEAFFADVTVERERQFRKVWLPAVLSPRELHDIENMSMSVLKNLYERYWDLGYFGFHRLVNPRKNNSNANS